MPYPEYLIAPMRQELTDLGVRECRTAADVDAALKSPGVVMMVVNSVCGCAAGKARPGIAMALKHPNRPDVVATVFAGADMDATDRARAGLHRLRRPRRRRSPCCATASCSTWSSGATSRCGRRR